MIIPNIWENKKMFQTTNQKMSLDDHEIKHFSLILLSSKTFWQLLTDPLPHLRVTSTGNFLPAAARPCPRPSSASWALVVPPARSWPWGPSVLTPGVYPHGWQSCNGEIIWNYMKWWANSGFRGALFSDKPISNFRPFWKKTRPCKNNWSPSRKLAFFELLAAIQQKTWRSWESTKPNQPWFIN